MVLLRETDLGNAFLSQQQDVMDAVQRERRKAKHYGYLVSLIWTKTDYAATLTTVWAKPR